MLLTAALREEQNWDSNTSFVEILCGANGLGPRVRNKNQTCGLSQIIELCVYHGSRSLGCGVVSPEPSHAVTASL